MTQRWSLEIRVGAFVVTGIVLLIVFIFFIGDVSTYFQPGYRLRVLFPSANGITKGSPVQYAGVEVGKVQRVEIVQLADHKNPHVEVHIRLPSSILVRADDEADISTFGLLGEKYLALSPGPGEAEYLEREGRLVGKAPVSTELIMERSDEVLNEFKRALEGLNRLVGDEESQVYMKEALQEARDATRHWRALGERLNVAIQKTEAGEGTLGKFLFDEELYDKVSLLVEDLRAHPWKLLVRSRTTNKASGNK